jgi:hypothetical protein
MPTEALYAVYFRAKGDGTEKAAKGRVYSFAIKNKKYYMDVDDDIRRGYNLSPTDFLKEPDKTPDQPKKIEASVLSLLEEAVPLKIDSFSPVVSDLSIPVVSNSTDTMTAPRAKFTLEDAKEACATFSAGESAPGGNARLSSKRMVSGMRAAQILSDLGFPFWGKPAAQTRERLAEVVTELCKPKEVAPPPAPPANVLVESYDEPESIGSSNEFLLEEIRLLRTELESVRRYNEAMVDVMNAAMRELLTQTVELRDEVRRLREAPAPAPAPPPAEPVKVESERRVVEKIPVAHKSTAGLRVNEILNEGENVQFRIKKEDGTNHIFQIPVNGDCLRLPDDIEPAKRYCKSPTTALKLLKELLFKQGLRSEIGSSTEDGWRAAYVIRNNKEIRLISIPKHESGTPHSGE